MYRKLTPDQIAQLTSQGCRAENWDNVEAVEGFTPERIFNCCFAGRVRLGRNVVIANIGSHIANYEIGDDVSIRNCSVVECTAESTFGNGVEVAAVNEAGGREVPMYDRLSSQIAYIVAMYRHRPACVEALKKLIGDYTASVTAGMGTIGRGTKLCTCGILRNVRIGAEATLEGVDMLENVTINSTAADRTFLGVGVKAYDTIFSAGSHTDNGAVLKHCFVGEACHIDYNYTAENSLFFANSLCANGEACSIFAGPFTVSHHKSTLLIAGIFSFFNAGSGSNQSNHLFKSGAVHQGVHERGVKFGSDAYIMLPAREGAFSVVLGRHKDHHDTSLFPFSYLMEEEGKSYLVPAVNLRSYGTVRDLSKWPRRNNRREANLDVIRFEEHNPYVAGKIRHAIEISEKMLTKEGVDTYNYQRVRIKQVMLRRGLNLYRQALAASLGAMLRAGRDAGITAKPKGHGAGNWVDLSGMFAPQSAVSELLDRIEKGEFATIDEVAAAIRKIDDNYLRHAYAWAEDCLAAQLGRRAGAADIEHAINAGEEAALAIKTLSDEDARRDRDLTTRTGYGIDSTGEAEIDADFIAVRGK